MTNANRIHSTIWANEKNSLENLSILCRMHNRFQCQRQFEVKHGS